MTLYEVMLEENEGKKFKCLDNGFTTKNDSGVLMYLSKKNKEGIENWNECIISKVWVNAKYSEIKTVTGKFDI